MAPSLRPAALRDPYPHTPPLGPYVARRTAVLDTLSPQGPAGPMEVHAVGYDSVATGETAAVVGHATCRVRVDRWSRQVLDLTAMPETPALASLVGHSVARGFRRRVRPLVPESEGAAGILYQLLDDLPGATVVATYVPIRAGVEPPDNDGLMVAPDLCAGWAEGGSMLQLVRETGRPVAIAGPAAPHAEAEPHTPHGHELPSLPPHGMRRIRRIDVRDSGTSAIEIEAHFRDSHSDQEGHETVLHEYRITAAADADGRLTDITARPHVLPFPECPIAAASTVRLIGAEFRGLRERIRTDFTGPSTCTHLNDMVRALEDVPALAAYLRTPEAR
ncbi:DUF2889 domain-containing protein [Rhodococcus sp. WS4]|nr:DUF2889 domain-containing protein [Rhodococcus sp. WS4]